MGAESTTDTDPRAPVVGQETLQWSVEPDLEPEREAEAVAEAPDRPKVLTPASLPRHEQRAARGWRVAAIIGLIVAGLLSAATVLLWQQVDDLGDDVARTRTRVTDASGVVASVATLEQSVADLKASVSALTEATGAANGTAAAATADVKAQLALLQSRTDALAACVNTYMDVIGGWSRNMTPGVVYAKC